VALKERLQADLTAAMKGRDELTTATLRMVLTAVGTEEVAGKAARQLSDDELAALVRDAVAEAGASGPQAMGTVMKKVGPRVAGRAEGGRVAAAVRAALSG
jgi:uncharacterized protein YqeY